MSRAAFFDRDGALNELVWFEEAGIVDAPFHEDHMRLIPGAAEVVRSFGAAGYEVVVVSNQPAVAKAHCSRAGLDRITRHMHELLAREGARLDAVYYCIHHPEARLAELRATCDCRKPRPGLLLIGRVRCDLCHHLAEHDCRPDWLFPSILEAARFLTDQEGDSHAAIHRHSQYR